MKYLITGGCGFVGSNIAAEIIAKNGELIVFDNLFRFGSSTNLDWLKSLGKFKFIHGDIRNTNDVENTIKNECPDAVFHLAGQVAMTTSIENPRLDFEINALGSFNILNAIRKYSPETPVLYSSTNKVYGDFEYLEYRETDTRYIPVKYPEGFAEDMPLDFHSPYGTSKGSADQYMLDFARMYGLKTVVFRHSSMYGGHQFATYDQGWIGWFCQKAIEIKNNPEVEPFTISGSGKQVRDVIFAPDVVSLYMKALKNIEKTKGNAFNIGGGIENSLSLIELFNLLEDILDINMKYKKNPARESDQRFFVADISKITNMTDWLPVYSPKDGIKKTLNWLQGK